MYRTRFVVLMALAATVAACAGGDGPTGVITPPVDTTPKLVSVVASGDPTMVVGTTKNYVCVATYDRGPTRDCTTPALWGALPSTVVRVNAGVATALQPGNVQITVTFEGKSYTLNVEVRPDSVVVAYNQLTATQKEMVSWFMASNRTLWRLDIAIPTPIWVEAKFPAQDVALAKQYWENRIPGLHFSAVSDSTPISVVKMVYDSTVQVGYETDVCGDGGGGYIVNDVLTGGRIRIRPDQPVCSNWQVLAHELGHVLGSKNHPPLGTDIMSARGRDSNRTSDNPDQTAALSFVFNVAPLGWKVPLSSMTLMEGLGFGQTRALDFVAPLPWK